MSELNQIRYPRILAWCSLHEWTGLTFVEKEEKWYAFPPDSNKLTLLPSIAWKPPFPGDIPEGS